MTADIYVRMEPSVKKLLTEIAKQDKESVSVVVRRLIREEAARREVKR